MKASSLLTRPEGPPAMFLCDSYGSS